MITVTDLFSGGGGFSEGLRQAGFRIDIAANHWPVAVATHKLNHPGTEHRTKDLSEVDWRTFPSTTVLAASPSCVWHARSGGRKRQTVEAELRRDDAGSIDRATAFAVIEAAEVHRYPVILIENVAEFMNWVLYRWWLDGLRTLGYRLNEMVLDAADFGHAQNRKRLIIVAALGLTINLTPPARTVVPASTIIGDDPLAPVTRHLYVSGQIAEIPVEDVPYLVTYRNHAKARRADESPLATITAGGNHHAVAVIRDGVAWHRLLTNRECARGQGFPDTYQFTGKPSDVKRQIGNAIPVGIARWLGTRVTAALEGAAA